MYPRPSLTTVHVDRLTADLCGVSRPTHFDGVTTVVTKLFAIAGPCVAFLGRKDAQQLAVITRMADDLNLPVRVVGCPIVREPDGLAMSSRNAYLAAGDRAAAPTLYASLGAAVELIVDGERDPSRVVATIRSVVDAEPRLALEYVEVRDAHELTELDALDGSVLLAVAARIGGTRLIDNVTVRVDGANVDADLGVGCRDLGTGSRSGPSA
jgi:pantoate--beta-alanine ligase